MENVRRWGILVFLNAPASFAAALVSDHTTALDFFEMFLGVLTFVVIALLIDRWLRQRNAETFRQALVKATYVKMGLQLIPAIEIGAGIVAAFFTENLFGMSARGQVNVGQVGQTYLMTVLTGAVLTVIVFLVAFGILFFRKPPETGVRG